MEEKLYIIAPREGEEERLDKRIMRKEGGHLIWKRLCLNFRAGTRFYILFYAEEGDTE